MNHWLSDSLTEWFTDWVIHWWDWLTDWVIHWLSESLTEWLTDWVIHWRDWLTDWWDWLTDSLRYRGSCRNELYWNILLVFFTKNFYYMFKRIFLFCTLLIWDKYKDIYQIDIKSKFINYYERKIFSNSILEKIDFLMHSTKI